MREVKMERIGFIGLGIMGKPMARNLIKAGHSLVVHDINRPAVEEIAAEGAKAASSSKEVAGQCDVVITMLPDSPDVQQAVLGPDGVADGVSAGMLFIDMSTIAPGTARNVYAALKAKGVESLDAPVSGGEVGAKGGTLSIMVGGTEAAFQRAKPIFEVMGKNIVLIGEPGAGQVTKACNQIVVGVTIQAVSEALILARKSGVDPARVREALLGVFAQSRILDLHGQRIIDRTFQPGFRVRLHRKDLAIALQTGREVALPLMLTSQVAELMNAMIARGDGDLDHSGLARLLEQMGGEG
jgi:2-hydroxy-3-oxopropionate reductase